MSVRIIAEAGVNHNGDMDLAKKLVDVASDAGADYVKFQTFKANKLATANAEKAEYQKATDTSDSQYEMLKKLEFKHEQHFEIDAYCKSRNIKFLSSPFDLESLDFLDEFEFDFYKVPSGEITNYPLLKRLGEKGKPVVLSSGMAYLKEIRDALSILLEFGLTKDRVTVLHCNSQYPSPFADVNLRAMGTIKENLSVNVGYSDHTNGIEVSIAAVALGAQIIEKHFTLDNKMKGPDHSASLEPDELKAMCRMIRNVELSLGSHEKRPSQSESANIDIVRKSVVASRKIRMGETFSEENLTTKRPGTGVSPMKWTSLIGRIAQRDYEEDDFIEEN